MSDIIRNTPLQQGVFWIFSYYVLINVFTQSSSYQKIDFIYTAIFLVSLAIPVLLNLYLLIPVFLKKGRYPLYALTFLAALFLFTWLNQMIFAHFIDLVLPGYFFISYYSYWDLLKFFIVFMGITTLLQLSKEWFELNASRQNMLQLEKEKVDAELKALANQVNPHFLFNSLNVIYSLAVNERKESPEAILKLSDILRYVIYDSSGDRVKLKEEADLIRNYIGLQRFRVGSQVSISFNEEVADGDLLVAPMLLLPLVENGFKHGLMGDVEDTYLSIRMSTQKNELHFQIENNKGKGTDAGERPASGVGLENIRNRLKLIYPGSHTFTINDSGPVFRVELIIRNLSPMK